jgi:hypothetical protein
MPQDSRKWISVSSYLLDTTLARIVKKRNWARVRGFGGTKLGAWKRCGVFGLEGVRGPRRGRFLRGIGCCGRGLGARFSMDMEWVRL